MDQTLNQTLNQTLTCITIFTLACLLFSLSPALAAPESDTPRSPYFFIESQNMETDPFPLKSTTVEVAIAGVIADVTVVQTYQNTGTRPVTAKYVFPASTRAAVHGMEMRIGSERIRAKIHKRKIAEKKFTAAKQSGRSASLLAQHRPNVFSMNVANILPGDLVEITLHYTELLVPADGTYEFVYPAVVGPRYAGLSANPESAPEPWLANPYLNEEIPNPAAFDISCHLSTGIDLAEISCASHDTRIDWKSPSSACVKLARGETGGGNRDYMLQYRLSGRQMDTGLMLYESGNEKFFLLTVQPPARVLPADIVAREYIFVVDVSGSMHGFPLNTAKKLMKDLLHGLRPVDRFNVVLFSGGASVFSPTSIEATTGNVAAAVRHIEKTQGGGGTRLAAALDKSFRIPGAENCSRSLIVVTDGYIAAEKEIFALIKDNLNQANVFSFGIGTGVNRYLIEGMARAGRGEPFVVTDPQKAGHVAEKFRQYIASPVLTDIRMECKGFDTCDVTPRSIPDLFALRPVVVFGKWRGLPRGTITVSGTGGAGRFTRTIDVSRTAPEKTSSALKYLWARTRLAHLSDFSPDPDHPAIKAEITTLGLRYHLLTKYTSFLAVHETIRNPGGQNTDVRQPLPLPRHVSALAVGNTYATVPEPSFFWLAGGLLLVAGLRKLTQKKKNC